MIFRFEFHIRIYGAGKPRRPLYELTVHDKTTWEEHEGVGCAAYAVNHGLNYIKKQYKRPEKKHLALKHAKALEKKLGWGKERDGATLMEDLGSFVEEYPDHKLVVLAEGTIDSGPMAVYRGKDYVSLGPFTKPKKAIYLVHDEHYHYGLCSTPCKIAPGGYNHNKWCYDCDYSYNPEKQDHYCDAADEDEEEPEEEEYTAKVRNPTSKCRLCGTFTCGIDEADPTANRKRCHLTRCSTCNITFERSGAYHHCVITTSLYEEDHYQFNDGKGDLKKGQFACLVYDFESTTEEEESETHFTYECALDENDKYPDVIFPIRRQIIARQKVNMACVVDMENQSMTKSFYGENALTDFLMFLRSYNAGNNVCIAHNASGYDAQLIFHGLAKIMPEHTPKIIMNGSKVMQLKLRIGGIKQHLIFRDSYLHLPGSLKNLIKEFKVTYHTSQQLLAMSQEERDSIVLAEKGDFPHKFNTAENQAYAGPIPPRDVFPNNFKTDEEHKKFMKWYREKVESNYVWNLRNELETYCMNDTICLAKIVKMHHDACMESFGISPWFFPTAAGFSHNMILQRLIRKFGVFEGREDDQKIYREKLEKLALEDFWPTLIPYEYWFCKSSFRGGRTDVRKMYHELSDDDLAKGHKIEMMDITSQYPYAQASKPFPTGKPTVHIWDKKYLPCTHSNCYNTPSLTCNIHWSGKVRVERALKNLIVHEEQPDESFFFTPDFFGFITVSHTPPTNIFHPVLVDFDEDLNKSISDLEPKCEKTYASFELQKAIRRGYKIDKVHAYHQYNKRTSLWADDIRDLYMKKMMYAGPNPDHDIDGSPDMNGPRFNTLRDAHIEKFGTSHREAFEATRGKWEDNPARKKAAKIALNTIWGKHVESPIHSEHLILNKKKQMNQIRRLYEDFTANKYINQGHEPYGDERQIFKKKRSGEMAIDSLKNGYAPAAIMVPAYGRMQLGDEMDKLDDRVFYHDTDSVVYLHIPGKYHIEPSETFGEWEEENVSKISKHGGIRKFVALGPKTYVMTCIDGKNFS